MAAERMAFGPQAGMTDAPIQIFGNIEWTKSLSEAPIKAYVILCQETLSASKRRLQENTEYLKNLSECKGPADVFACHGEFIRKVVSNSFDDGMHTFDCFYKNLSTAAPSK